MSEQFPAHNEIMELLYGKPARQYLPDIIGILGNIDGTDESVLPLLKRLLTTGSANARAEARKAFLDTAYNFQMAYDDSEDSYQTLEADEKWDHFLDGYEHPVIRNNILGVWNAANVIDESGRSITVRDVTAGMRAVPFFVEDIDPDSDEQAASDPYWRGLAAVAISRCVNPAYARLDLSGMKETVPGFIEWAGTHDDIAKIIDIAVERGSFDRRLLEGIMAEQSEKTVLSSGVL